MTTWQPVNTSSTESQSLGRDEDNVTSFSPLLRDVSGVLWQTVPPLLLLVGSVGNVMTMVVMRAMRASQSTACIAVYFTALAVSDLGLLTSSVFWYWMDFQVAELASSHVLFCLIPFFTCYVSSMTSAWLLVVMTYQRVTSVVLPHRVGVLCTVKRAKIIIAVIVTVAIIVNMHIFFNYRMGEGGDDFDVCQSIDDNLANIFTLLDLILASVTPFLFLLIGNIVLIHRVMASKQLSLSMTSLSEKQAASRSEKVSSLTITLILTSLAFGLLTLPTCIADAYLEAVGFYKGTIDDPDQYAGLAFVETVSVLLWMSNSAVNFYIYILSGSKFREEAKKRLCLTCPPANTPGTA